MSAFETEQLALFVTPGNIKELNDHLSQGWKVVQTCATFLSAPSKEGFVSPFAPSPTCLVVLERAKSFGQVSNVHGTGAVPHPFPA